MRAVASMSVQAHQGHHPDHSFVLEVERLSAFVECIPDMSFLSQLRVQLAELLPQNDAVFIDVDSR